MRSATLAADVPIRPKLLLFDLDGVLADYRRDLRCRQLAQSLGVAEAQVDQALFSSGLEARSDRGDLDLPDYLDALRKQFGWNLPEPDFVAARRAATRVRPGALALGQQLEPQVALAIFTNNGAWFGEQAARIVPELVPLFGRRLVCSGAIGACKPATEAFAACLQRLGFSPASTLFVDDAPANIEGARMAGLDSVQFQSLAELRAELFERGLDPGEDHED
jgi:HAD superfamily hydrolase (TIGR01509 family)